MPDVIALVYGGAKAGAVRAAIRGGLINSIVTHSLLARQQLLECGPLTRFLNSTGNGSFWLNRRSAR